MENYLVGVIEGFYGSPWSIWQRKTLFQRMNKLSMNTYLYAPKDDLKHRAEWRLSYTNQESLILKELISESINNKIEFVYAISPGLDISYSSENDQNILINKFEQLFSLGCRSFAILFDDIDNKIKNEDEIRFSKFSKAQCFITNLLYEKFKSNLNLFLFCPTEYCTKFSEKANKTSVLIENDFKLENSEYLNTIGTELNKNINILWTGPSVISTEITLQHIEELINVLKRKPLIWENYHANDYDRSRIFLGPIKSRHSSIKNNIKGILTNPNCEFELNFNAFYSLSKWFEFDFNEENETNIDILIENEIKNDIKNNCLIYKDYNIRHVFLECLKNWLPIFYEPTQVNKIIKDEEIEIEKINEANMSELSLKLFKEAKQNAMNSFSSFQICETNKQDLFNIAESGLDLVELKILSDFFYLPFDNGYYALYVLNLIKMCFKSNSSNLEKLTNHHEIFKNFILPKFESVCIKLQNIPNKQIRQDLLNNRLLGELKQTLIVVKNCIDLILDQDLVNKEREFEIKMRGGLSTDLKRYLEIENIYLTNLCMNSFTNNKFDNFLVKDNNHKKDLMKNFNLDGFDNQICFEIKDNMINSTIGILISDQKDQNSNFKNINFCFHETSKLNSVDENFELTIRLGLAILISYHKLFDSKGILINFNKNEVFQIFEKINFLENVNQQVFKYEFF